MGDATLLFLFAAIAIGIAKKQRWRYWTAAAGGVAFQLLWDSLLNRHHGVLAPAMRGFPRAGAACVAWAGFYNVVLWAVPVALLKRWYTRPSLSGPSARQ